MLEVNQQQEQALCSALLAVARAAREYVGEGEYGQLKLSILGVRNVVYDIDARADNAAEAAANAMCHKLVLAEDALRDWQSKYPDDAWIPKFGYAMLKDYEKIDSAIIADDSHIASIHAIDLANWLEGAYPNSEFAPK